MTGTVDPAIQRPANQNGFVWEVGNGLAKTTVVTYLARELGAEGAVVGFILAAPYFAGVLRLVMPWLLTQARDRQALTLAFLVPSSLVLMLVPLVAQRSLWPTEGMTLGALSITWGLWHLLLYLGVVALFT